MKRFRLTFTPHTSIFIGGYAPALGASDGDTAVDHEGLLVPGTVAKGALRESATRLVGDRYQDAAARVDALFGAPQELGAAEGIAAKIRVGPLRAVDPEGRPLPLEPTLRHHVSLERATRQAVPGRLFQNRVSTAGHGLRFVGELQVLGELSDEERQLLEAACQITDQIGGGRGRGLGLVRCELEELPAANGEAPTVVVLPREEGTDLMRTVVLALEATEPLRLGVVKSRDNVMLSKDHLDGSAVRGAVAASLARLGSEGDLQRVLDPRSSPACFGNGYLEHPGAIPAPLTLREAKGSGALYDEALDLAAHVLTERSYARRDGYSAASGTFVPAWRKARLERRVITRAARNLADGRAAPGLLYSLEVVEPIWVERKIVDGTLRERHHRTTFHVPVHGTAEQLDLVVRAAAAGLWLGGSRTRGQGTLRLVDVHTRPTLEPLAERHAQWCARLAARAVEAPERSGVLLALGPLAVDVERLRGVLEHYGLELFHGVSRRQAHGGWNSRARLPRTVVRPYVPGTTLLVRSRDGASCLPALAQLEAHGVGPGRADGWGRLVACHPIHLDASEDTAP